MIRDLVLTLTILAIIFLAAHQPPPARMVQVDYCPVDKRVAGKEILTMPDGSPVIRDGRLVERWKFGWAKMYRPCSELDRFEFI